MLPLMAELHCQPILRFIPPVVPKASLRPIGSSQVSKRERGPDGICARSITPECLQQLYNIPSEHARSTNNSLYVTGMGGEVANHQDLQVRSLRLSPLHCILQHEFYRRSCQNCGQTSKIQHSTCCQCLAGRTTVTSTITGAY